MKFIAAQNRSQILRLLRNYSKKEDSLILANALELLSPSKSAENYKPSLLRNLQKGSVGEHYSEILPKLHIPKRDHLKRIGSLLDDLNAAVGTIPRQLKANGGGTKNIVIKNEDQILDFLRLSYYKGDLTPHLLTQLLLNPHLRNLSRLPFDIENMNGSNFKGSGWTPLHFVQFKVMLLKKYHDLKQPKQIHNILERYFISLFLPLIVQGELLAMYERIVWKFCFDRLEHYEETQVIEELDSLRSSILIWEASFYKNKAVAEKILSFHSPSPLLETFFEIASCEPIQKIIDNELKSKVSPTLSKLKKISTKCKLHSYENSNTAIGRALAYSIIHNLEQFLSAQTAESGNSPILQKYVSRLETERNIMVERSDVHELRYDDKLYTD